MMRNTWPPREAARRLLPLLALATFFTVMAQPQEAVSSCKSLDGKSKSQAFGGRDAKHEEFPWQVSIGRTDQGNYAFERHWCGGSLIGDRWVLTAARCVGLPIKTLRVVHGASNLSRAGSAAMRRVAAVYVRPGYDIALLRLSEPIDEPASYANLPEPEEDIFGGACAVVTGWEKDKAVLQAVNVRIVDADTCREAYREKYGPNAISAGEVCAAFLEGGRDLCPGDSGGPLVVEGDGGQYMFAGVVGRGEGCAQDEKYGVYARVSHHMHWIRETKKKFAANATSLQQETIRIDLANGEKQEIKNNPGSYVIEFLNAIPGENYFIEIDDARSTYEMDPLPLSMGTASSTQGPDCALSSGASSEEDVREIINSGKCSEEQIFRTKFKRDLFYLPAQASRTITVKREDSDFSDKPEREWKIVITSGVQGKWQTTFGWMFTANRDKDYFTDPVDENGKFRIVLQNRSRNSLTSLPSIFWHWLRAGQAHKKLQHGPTAGVGISIGEDASRPAVFAGYTLRYQQNIGIVSGVGVYSRRVLNGRYREGAIVTSDLESSQLTENANHFMFFAGVTFRVNFAKLFGQGNNAPSGE